MAGVTFNVVTRFQGQDYERGVRAARGETDLAAKATAALARQLVVLWAAYGGSQAIRQAIRDAEAWNRSVVQIINLTDLNRKQLAAWEPELRRIAVAAGRLPQELLGGLQAVTSAGIVGAEALQVTERAAKAAAVGLGEVNVIARTVSAAVQAYGPQVLSAAQATDVLIATVRAGAAEADQIAPVLGQVVGIAQQLGVSFAEVGGFIATFTRLGVGADEAVTALRGTLTTLLGPTKQQQEALALVNMTMADLRAEIEEKGLARALVDLVERFQGNEDALSAIIPNVRALAGVLGTAGAQGEQFVEIQRAIEDSTGDLDRAFQEWLKSPAGQMEQMRAELANIRLEIGNELLPVVLEVTAAIREMFGGDSVESAGRFAEVLGWIVRRLKDYVELWDRLSLLHWVTASRQASEAAIELDLRLANLEGSANRFVRTMQESGGRVSEGMLKTAWADAKALSTELNTAQAKLDALRAKQSPRPGPLGMTVHPGPITGSERRELAAAEAEVQKLTAAYEPLKRALSGVVGVYGDISLAAPEAGRAIAAVVDDELAKRIADATAALQEQIVQARILGEAIGKGEEAETAAARAVAVRTAATKLGVAADSALAAGVRALAGVLFDLEKANDQTADAQKRLFAQAEQARSKWANPFNAAAEDIIQSQREVEEATRRAWEAGQAMADEFRARARERIDLEREVILLTEGPYRGALAQADFWFADFVAHVKDLEKRRVISAEQATEAVLAAEEELARLRAAAARAAIDQQLSDWGTLFNFLEDRVGGVFAALARAVGTMQQTMGAVDAAAGIAGAAGWKNLAMGLAAAAPMIAVMIAAYEAFDAHAKNRQAQKYNRAVVAGMDQGQWANYGATGLIAQGEELSFAFRKAAEAVAEGLGGALRSLVDVEIQVRRDGKYFAAFVAGEMIGHFESLEEATKAALQAAFRNPETMVSGLSDLVRQGLSELGGMRGWDELGDLLGGLREIAEIRWTEGARSMAAAVRQFDEWWSVLRQLRELTPAVVQAHEDLVASEADAWQAWSDSITGREKTAAELLAEKQREGELFNARRELRLAEIALDKLELQAEILYLEGRIKGADAGRRIDIFELEGKRRFIGAKLELAQAEASIDQQRLDALYAMVAAYDALVASMPGPIDIGSIRLPRGGGAGGGPTDEDRDRLREEAAGWGATPIGEVFAETQRWFDEWAERFRDAGFKGAEAADLMADAEEELARRRDKITKSQVQASGAFIGRGTALGGPVLSGISDINREMNELLEGNRQLVEEGELSVAEMRRLNNAIREAGERQRQQLAEAAQFGLLGELYNLLGMEEEAAQLAYQLKLAELRIAYEELKIANEVYGLNLEWLDEIGELIDEFERRGPAAPGDGDGTTTESGDLYNKKMEKAAKDAEEWAKKFADAMALLEGYELEDAGDRLTETLKKIDADFEIIREALGDTERVQTAYAKAVQRAIDEFLDPVREARKALILGPQGSKSAEDKFALLLDEVLQAQDAFRAGDLSVVEDVPDLIQQLLDQAALVSPFGSQGYRMWEDFAKGFYDEILALGGGEQLEPLGSGAGNPMHVAGMNEVVDQLSQGHAEQYNALTAIRDSGERTASAVESIDYRLATGIRILGGLT